MPHPTTTRIPGDGVQLSVNTWGEPDRPTVVLVHGYPDTHAVWIPVAEALVDRGFHVAAADVRGAGASDVPAGLEAYRLEHLVGDLAAVLHAVSPQAPVHLVGHDWGSIQCWDALADARLDGRIATYTSISGLPLDHASRWLRARARDRSFGTLLRQGVRSSYVAFFHLPGVARLARRGHGAVGRSRSRWAATLRRMDSAQIDDAWPSPTFGEDVGNGMALYRANFRDRLRRSRPARPTDVPVQLVIPTRDRFVPAWLFDGIESVAPNVRRREVDARHWVVRSQPVEVAAWIADHIAATTATAEAEEARP
jgi:pimeloyl-ACP methyl ester carboxylesterase